MFSNYEPFGSPLLTDASVPNSARFVLENTTGVVANTIRRCILTETRSVSFRADLTNSADPGIVVRKNTSPIFNEMLAHRLTLLPLGVVNISDFDPTRYECVLSVKNDVRGPITPANLRHVTASDFIVRERQEDGEFVTLDGPQTAALFPKDPMTGQSSLLITLRPQWNPGQPSEEIDLTAYPVIGRGRDFMGFSPVSQCSFENTRDDDPVRRDAFFNAWMAEYKKVDDPASVADAVKASYREEWETMAAQRCFKVGADGQANSFTFAVESVGMRPVADIVAEGLRAAIDLVTPYANVDRPMSELGMSTQPVDSRMAGINVIFEDQEHTLGALLQSIICEMYLDREAVDSPITYVGYRVRHPLQRKLTLTLAIRSGVAGEPASIARRIIADAAERARALFEQLLQSWSTAITGQNIGRMSALAE